MHLGRVDLPGDPADLLHDRAALHDQSRPDGPEAGIQVGQRLGQEPGARAAALNLPVMMTSSWTNKGTTNSDEAAAAASIGLSCRRRSRVKRAIAVVIVESAPLACGE